MLDHILYWLHHLLNPISNDYDGRLFKKSKDLTRSAFVVNLIIVNM